MCSVFVSLWFRVGELFHKEKKIVQPRFLFSESILIRMGSYAKAVMVGYICRLCSEQKKKVIHLYSSKAQSLQLLEKIKLLPITVQKYDNLPKTICEACIDRLEAQYNLVQIIKKSDIVQRSHRMFHSNGRCPIECPLYGTIDPAWTDPLSSTC
ncbi:uncharacterized protein LOC123671064 [Harmonia axyridis]|uniref:uncharacterized protein LOC123671064 n=1 Tax=Harmonia axyridis TaxID=115357 RepID=UPI001E2761D9|nr:uncharacterized protein LOC123671064 [Harmonia axyridis]